MTYQNGDVLVPGPLTDSSGRLSKESFRAGGAGDESGPILVCLFVCLSLQSTLQAQFFGALWGQKTMNFPTLASRFSVQSFAQLAPPLRRQVYGDQVLLLYLQSRVDESSQCLLASEGKG